MPYTTVKCRGSCAHPNCSLLLSTADLVAGYQLVSITLDICCPSTPVIWFFTMRTCFGYLADLKARCASLYRCRYFSVWLKCALNYCNYFLTSFSQGKYFQHFVDEILYINFWKTIQLESWMPLTWWLFGKWCSLLLLLLLRYPKVCFA